MTPLTSLARPAAGQPAPIAYPPRISPGAARLLESNWYRARRAGLLRLWRRPAANIAREGEDR